MLLMNKAQAAGDEEPVVVPTSASPGTTTQGHIKVKIQQQSKGWMEKLSNHPTQE